MQRVRPVVLSTLVCLSSCGLLATAQAATSDKAAQSAEVEGLKSIIITATKRRTNVQSTPISITAITAAEIASRGVADFQTLARSVPGLSILDAGPNESEFEMRGLESFGGVSSVVGFYIGDVPISSPASSLLGKTVINPDLYDLERVEVLRGPQGTLYGASSEGGTVRLIPAEPKLHSFLASAEQKVSDTINGGGLNHTENAMVNVPLGDTAAVRIVGSFTRNSGWIKRLVLTEGSVTTDPGVFPDVVRPTNFYTAPLQEALSKVNTVLEDSIRAQLLWKPTDNLTVEPMAMYLLTEQGAPPEVDVNGAPTHPTTPLVKAHYEPFDTPEPQKDTFSLGSLKLAYQLPEFSVISSTGFWHRDSLITQDGAEQISSVFGIPAYSAAAGGLGPLGPETDGPGATQPVAMHQLSEEFRLVSTKPLHVGMGDLNWVAGYYYEDLHSQTNELLFGPEAAPVIGSPPIEFASFQPEVITQNAIFADLTWRITPHLSLEAGLRHYHYSLSTTLTGYGALNVNAAFGYPNDVPLVQSFSNKASGNLPAFTLTYNINSDAMLYAKASEGFRIGGAAGTVPVADPGPGSSPFPVAVECGVQAKVLLTTTCNPNILIRVPATFRSDSLWSYEVGEKSYFFSHRMLFDIDAYFEKWANPQMPTDIAGFDISANGGTAHIKGLEFQLENLLPLGFDLSLNGSYTDARFVETNTLVGIPAGTEVPNIAKLTGSAVLHWTHSLSDSSSVFGSLEEDYVGRRTTVPTGITITTQNINQFLVHMPSYSMVDLRVGISGEREGGGKWTATLFVDNLTNSNVLLDTQSQLVLQTSAYTRYTMARPLTLGIDATYNFR